MCFRPAATARRVLQFTNRIDGADQMDDAGLDHRPWPRRLDGVLEPGQSVAAGDEDVATPRLRRSVITLPQNRAPSPAGASSSAVLASQMPSTCFSPSPSMPAAR